MEENLIQASFFTVGAFSFYTIYRLYLLIFKEPKIKWLGCCLFYCWFFSQYNCVVFQQKALIMLFTNIIIYFFLSLNYDARMLKRVLLSLGSYGLFIVSETLIVAIFAIAKMDILHNRYFQIWGSVLTALTAYVIVSAVSQQAAIKAQSYHKARHTVFLGIVIFMIFGISFVLPYIGEENVGHMLSVSLRLF